MRNESVSSFANRFLRSSHEDGNEQHDGLGAHTLLILLRTWPTACCLYRTGASRRFSSQTDKEYIFIFHSQNQSCQGHHSTRKANHVSRLTKDPGTLDPNFVWWWHSPPISDPPSDTPVPVIQDHSGSCVVPSRPESEMSSPNNLCCFSQSLKQLLQEIDISK